MSENQKAFSKLPCYKCYKFDYSILFAYKYRKVLRVLSKKCYWDITSGYQRYPIFINLCAMHFLQAKPG